MNTFLKTLGTAFMGGGLLWALWWVKVLLTWSRAAGTVVGLDEGVEVGDRHPRVEFMADDGRLYGFTSRYGIQIQPLWRVGRKVTVLYAPDKPANAEVLRLANLAMPLFVAGFGALLFYVGLLGLA